jgi:zinc protease
MLNPRLPAIVALASLALTAQTLPKGITKSASVEGITEYRLDNGLRVLLFPDRSASTVTVNVTYLVGSRHENYGETGMAHLLEHLVFKGTPKNPDIPKALKDHGAFMNGTTDYDRTNYYETMEASPENLKFGLELEADRMVNSFIAKKDLDSEMTVVRNEFEMGENSPNMVLEERVLSTAYLWHNYGKSVIGSRSDLENVPIDRLQAFYRKHYQPDNAVLTVAGKFDEAQALQMITSAFGPIPRPARKLDRTYTDEPTQDGERTVVLRRTGDVQLLIAAYHIPAGTHTDFPAIDVLARVLADTPSGRLYKALVDNKKAASISASAMQQAEPGALVLRATVRKEDSLDAARDGLLRTVQSVIQEPPSKEEVDRAKSQILKQIELNLNNSQQVGLQLSEWIAMGDWRMFFYARDKLREVTPADVLRVAKAYLKDSNRTIGTFIPTTAPDRAEIPAAPDVTALVKDYKGGAAIAAGEDFNPTPANVEARVQRSTLPSGLKVVLMPKQTRGGSVIAQIQLRMGDLKTLTNRVTAGQFAGQMLMRGTTRHNRQQIQDELNRLKARMNIGGGGAGQAVVTIETTRENLIPVLNLAAEVLREPTFPDTEFDQVKQANLARLESFKNEPQALAPTAMNQHLNPYPKGDPRATLSIDEQIEQIRSATLDEAKKYYAEFYGASNGEAVVVGDFDAAAVKKTLTDLLGNWKSPAPYADVNRIYQKVDAINRFVDTPDKANAVLFAGIRFPLRDSDPDYAALEIANYMFGGGALANRLGDRIRRKDGLSYGVQSALNASVKEPSGAFSIFAIAAPQNIAKVEAAMNEEIARVLKDGFAEDELAAAKKSYLKSEEVQRGRDGALAGILGSNEHWGRTMQWQESFEKKIAAVTLAEVNAAFRKYIVPSSISIVKAGDQKKAAPGNE